MLKYGFGLVLDSHGGQLVGLELWKEKWCLDWDVRGTICGSLIGFFGVVIWLTSTWENLKKFYEILFKMSYY